MMLQPIHQLQLYLGLGVIIEWEAGYDLNRVDWQLLDKHVAVMDFGQPNANPKTRLAQQLGRASRRYYIDKKLRTIVLSVV